jgi:hypothetical protein
VRDRKGPKFGSRGSCFGTFYKNISMNSEKNLKASKAGTVPYLAQTSKNRENLAALYVIIGKVKV